MEGKVVIKNIKKSLLYKHMLKSIIQTYVKDKKKSQTFIDGYQKG